MRVRTGLPHSITPAGTSRVLPTRSRSCSGHLHGPSAIQPARDLLTVEPGGDAAARFLMTSFNSGAGQFFTYLYFLTEYTAPVVIGFALWHSRRAPAAQPAVRNLDPVPEPVSI